MLEYDEYRLALVAMEKTIDELRESIGVDTLKTDIEKLENESAAPDFWDDIANSQ